MEKFNRQEDNLLLEKGEPGIFLTSSHHNMQKLPEQGQRVQELQHGTLKFYDLDG